MNDFAHRLNQVIEYYGIRVADLADRLQIQRSTLSHLFAGRNKPGFEFLERLAAAFPDLSLNWVVTGKGEMLANVPAVVPAPASTPEAADFPGGLFSPDLFSVTAEKTNPPVPEAVVPPVRTGGTSAVEQIILVYADGSFRLLHPQG